MPDPDTLSAADFDCVLDLAIELGDLARNVRREREAGKPRPDGVIATWETPAVKTEPEELALSMAQEFAAYLWGAGKISYKWAAAEDERRLQYLLLRFWQDAPRRP